MTLWDTRLGLALGRRLLVGDQHPHWLRRSVFGFAFFRFLLGIGEGFNWPGASKTVAEWFPSQERSLAVAIFDSGSSVGGAVARSSFPDRVGLWLAVGIHFSGALGFIWLAGMVARLPSPGSSSAGDTGGGSGAHPRRPGCAFHFCRARGVQRWLDLARNRNVWGIVLGRALTDPIWWFYVFWLPQYLSDARGFSLQRIALFAWMPFIAADIGNFTGGWISGYCIRRGLSVVRARLWVCAVSCLPILAGIPAATHTVFISRWG